MLHRAGKQAKERSNRSSRKCWHRATQRLKAHRRAHPLAHTYQWFPGWTHTPNLQYDTPLRRAPDPERLRWVARISTRRTQTMRKCKNIATGTWKPTKTCIWKKVASKRGTWNTTPWSVYNVWRYTARVHIVIFGIQRHDMCTTSRRAAPRKAYHF